jgi:hypothetical protein
MPHLYRDRSVSPWRVRPGLLLIFALLLGLFVRWWAFDHTIPIRHEMNQSNAFYWGNRLVRAANPSPGPARWGALWQAYVDSFVDNELHPAPRENTLDYVPLRLLMAAVWVNYLNIAYGPVAHWEPAFAASFTCFSLIMELAGTAAMFALVYRYTSRFARGHPTRWTPFQAATAAAILIWLNPASIVDSHIWPQGQTWVLPFYLGSMLAMLESRFMLAGAIFGLGVMFKGQMALLTPVLILWPVFDRRFIAAMRVVMGIAAGAIAVVWPWLIRGSFAWVRAGFTGSGAYSNVLRKGNSLNLPAVLAKCFHLGLHSHLFDRRLLGMHVVLELKTALTVLFLALLTPCTAGIARRARENDPRWLIAIAAPWALMFFIMGQMDSRYICWSACCSAGAIVVSRRALVAHLMLTFAGAASTLEFLLLLKPTLYPTLMHLLIDANSINWLLIAIATAQLFLAAVRRDSIPAIPIAPLPANDQLPPAHRPARAAA